jgi:hypothetical protein
LVVGVCSVLKAIGSNREDRDAAAISRASRSASDS